MKKKKKSRRAQKLEDSFQIKETIKREPGVFSYSFRGGQKLVLDFTKTIQVPFSIEDEKLVVQVTEPEPNLDDN